MLIIATQELGSPHCHIPAADGIVRRDGVLALADGVANGWFLTPAIAPTMAMRYVGFSLEPAEQGITVAILRADGVGDETVLLTADSTGYTIDTTDFTIDATDTALIYLSPEELRSLLPGWVGAIQLRIRLTRDADGRSPQVRSLRLGYEVAGDFLAYLINWVLRPWCGAPVLLTRNLATVDGTTLPIPARLNPAQMSDVQALSPGLRLLDGTLMANPGRIELVEAIAPGMVQLQFRYSPDVEHVTGIFQIDEVPVVLLRLLPGENHHRINATDWVRMPGDRAVEWQAARQYDQPVEIEVLAHTFEDARAIAQSLVSRVEQQGSLGVPAFGTTAIMRLRMPIQSNDMLQREGNLFSLRFRIAFVGLIDGEIRTEPPLLTEYIHDFEPRNT
ncbi:MAG: hypothetical protein SNJ57_13135 [Cyanobacteriota bacterium]